jgi:nucleoside-diphosphate kinase
MKMSTELAETHYAEHEGKKFYPGLVTYITSGPIVAMVWAGPQAIQLARNTMGATKPVDAAQGTIRGDLGLEVGRNLVHGSDGADTASREVALFFDENEIVEWQREADRWILE